MKALIAVQDFNNYKIGDIVLITDIEYVGYLLSNKHCESVEFSSSIKFPKAVLIPESLGNPQYWSKEGLDNVFTQPMLEDTSWTYHPAEGEDDEYWTKDEARTYEQPMIEDTSWEFHAYAAPVSAHYEIVEDNDKVKQETVSNLYIQMNKDVLDQMTVVFGTTNPESATAYKQTYDLMLAKPNLFVGKLGLIDEAAVTTYATTKITAIEEYAVWRMERIAQFKTERDAILGA